MVRNLRVRVHAGNLEPLETLPFEEGSELTVSFDVPEVPVTPRAVPALQSRRLGVIEPLTREKIYEDVG